MGEHIVIIEDDTSTADSMKMMLEMDGYEVSCLSELTSLEELIDMNADCFILDENLPVLHGHIICIMLRSNKLTHNIPVILTSASPKLAYVAGLSLPNASIPKPFEINQFLDSVHAVLN